MQIELEKYSKLDSSAFLKAKLRHQDSRYKLQLYVTLGLLVSIIGFSLQICYSTVDPVAFNKKLFEDDLETESMAAFIDFMVEYTRLYPDKPTTTQRYRIFK